MPDQKQTVPPRPDRSLLRQVLNGVNEQNQGDAYVLAGELYAVQAELVQRDQKQTVIVEVRADEVTVDDLLRLDEPDVWVELDSVDTRDNPGGSPIGPWTFIAYDGDRYGLTGRFARPAEKGVIVRRPVPSGADALREVHVGPLRLIPVTAENVQPGDRIYEAGKLTAPVHVNFRSGHKVYEPEDAEGNVIACGMEGEIVLVERTAVPAVASSGAEGGEADARFVALTDAQCERAGVPRGSRFDLDTIAEPAPSGAKGGEESEPRISEIHVARWDGTADGLRELAEWAGNDPTGEPQFSWLVGGDADGAAFHDPMLGEEGIRPDDMFAMVDGWAIPLRLTGPWKYEINCECSAPAYVSDGEGSARCENCGRRMPTDSSPASAGAEGEREARRRSLVALLLATWDDATDDYDEPDAPAVPAEMTTTFQLPSGEYATSVTQAGRDFVQQVMDELAAAPAPAGGPRCQAWTTSPEDPWRCNRPFPCRNHGTAYPPAPAPAVTDPEGDSPNEFRVTPERVIGRWRWVGDWQNYPSPALEGMFVAPQRSAPAPSKETSTDA